MSKRDFQRPTFRTRGKSTEAISGSDVPFEFRTVPRMPRPKAEQRKEAERALREFMKRTEAKTADVSRKSPATTERPPWED